MFVQHSVVPSSRPPGDESIYEILSLIHTASSSTLKK